MTKIPHAIYNVKGLRGEYFCNVYRNQLTGNISYGRLHETRKDANLYAGAFNPPIYRIRIKIK